jgi:hypothetical protein
MFMAEIKDDVKEVEEGNKAMEMLHKKYDGTPRKKTAPSE